MGFKVKYMYILNLNFSLPVYLLVLNHKLKNIDKRISN